MLVFTEQCVQELRQRYQRGKGFRKPSIYYVATNPKFQSMRAEIEAWVADLPHELQKKLIRRLRSPKNFRHTCHELAVGGLLKKAGFRAEYGKKFSAQTPDWYVEAKGDIKAFIVEVFTSNLSDSQMRAEAQIDELEGRLYQIPFDVVLEISYNSQGVELDQRRNKAIAQQLEQWLRKENPAVGDKLCLEGLTTEVVCRGLGFPGVELIIGPECSWTNPELLREKLKKKTKKYKELVTALKMPLIIGVVADFFTGFHPCDLENVLFGQEVFNVVYNKHTGEVVRQTMSRKNDGLFAERPLLSAAMWVWKSDSGDWKLKFFNNAFAKNPISPNAFDE